VVLELVLQDPPSVVILLLQAVRAAGMIMVLALANPPHPAQVQAVPPPVPVPQALIG